MDREAMATALRVLNRITSAQMPTQDDEDALKSLVAKEERRLPIDEIARRVVERELLKNPDGVPPEALT